MITHPHTQLTALKHLNAGRTPEFVAAALSVPVESVIALTGDWAAPDGTYTLGIEELERRLTEDALNDVPTTSAAPPTAAHPRPVPAARATTPKPAPAGFKIATVPVDRITFHAHNIRRDLGDLRTLTASIARFGIMQPVVLEHHGDRLRLRAGHRRVAAARLAGLTKVPAVIHADALEDDEWLAHAVQENTMRRGLDGQERRDVITALRDLGCTWPGIAETFGGVATVTVMRWAQPPGDRARQRQPHVSGAQLRTLADAWRAHAAAGHHVTADQVLDALDQVAATGAITDAMPTTRPHLVRSTA